MRAFVVLLAALVLAACASAPRGPATPTPLTSIDTAYYAVPGSTRSEWAVNLPRAARAAGIESGAPSYTLGHMIWSVGQTRTTSIGCQADRSVLLLRLGHVMPTLAPGATPSSEERAAWDAFVASLWERAHLREEVGARLADTLRAELRHARTTDCAQLIALTHEKIDAFPARYLRATQAAETELARMGP